MPKQKKYTIKKYKLKGGKTKKSMTTEQAARTKQQKNSSFMPTFLKTYKKLKKYRKKGETDWLTDEDLKIRDRDIVTAMNTANNVILGGKKTRNKSRKTRKTRKKHKK